MQSGGWGVFMAGWLAAGALLRGHCSKSMFYIMTIVLISLLRAFFVITKPNTQPLLSLLFHLSSLSSFSFFSFNSGPNDLSFFPVFWLTGYNLHMYFVLLYATYIRHHHHLSSSIMSYSRELVSRGERKKKALQVPVCIVHNLLSVRHMYVHVCTKFKQVVVRDQI